MPNSKKTVTSPEATEAAKAKTEAAEAKTEAAEAKTEAAEAKTEAAEVSGQRIYHRDYSSRTITTGSIQAKTDADLWAMAAAATNPNTPAFQSRTEVLKELVRRNKLSGGKANAPRRNS